MKKRFIILVLPALFLLAACQQNEIAEADTEEVVEVKVAKTIKVTEQFPILSSGKLASKTETRLSFKTAGIINSIHANEGQTVKAGQLLASLELEEINAQVKQAELAYDKSIRDMERVENLYRDSVATLENYQDAKTAQELAASTLKIARFNQRYSQIIAPAGGKILRKLASVNELVSPGMPVLLFASDNEAMVVRVHLIDREVVKLNLGDSAHVSFDAYPRQRFMAFVTEISNAADPYTGTYEVELELKPVTQKLLSGFIARVHIFPSSVEDLLEIPIGALVDARGYSGFVYTVQLEKAHRKQISIHKIRDQKVIIDSGLEAGELVVTEGVQYLDEGTSIHIQQNQ